MYDTTATPTNTDKLLRLSQQLTSVCLLKCFIIPQEITAKSNFASQQYGWQYSIVEKSEGLLWTDKGAQYIPSLV